MLEVCQGFWQNANQNNEPLDFIFVKPGCASLGSVAMVTRSHILLYNENRLIDFMMSGLHVPAPAQYQD